MGDTITIAEYKLLQKKQQSNKQLNKMIADLKYSNYVFQLEYVFCPHRKFRFDIALVDDKIAIEYEGTISEKSRHTTITGYSKDCEKYNLAQVLGWKVLRYTALNYDRVMNDIRMCLQYKN